MKVHYLRYRKAEIQTRSAALAYHTLLAFIPVIGLIFWYLRSIGVSKRWFLLIRNFLYSQMNVGDSVLIQYFDRLTNPVGGPGWGWVGLAVLFYTAWNLMDKFGRSLDYILDTAPDQSHIVKRGFIRHGVRRLIGIVDGKAATLGFGRRPAAALEVQACEAQASTAIGGESFRRVVVRAVAARRHGLASLVASSRDVEDAVG